MLYFSPARNQNRSTSGAARWTGGRRLGRLRRQGLHFTGHPAAVGHQPPEQPVEGFKLLGGKPVKHPAQQLLGGGVELLPQAGAFFCQADLLVPAVPAAHGAGDKALALQPLEDTGNGGVGQPQLLLDVLLVHRPAAPLGDADDDVQLRGGKIQPHPPDAPVDAVLHGEVQRFTEPQKRHPLLDAAAVQPVVSALHSPWSRAPFAVC